MHTQRKLRDANKSNKHVFGLWKTTRVPGGSPGMHEEKRQTPYRNVPTGTLESALHGICHSNVSNIRINNVNLKRGRSGADERCSFKKNF